MPITGGSNGQITLDVGVKLQVLQSSINQLQNVLDKLQPNSKGYKELASYLQQAQKEMRGLANQSGKAFTSQQQFTQYEKGIEKIESALSNVQYTMGNLSVNDLQLDQSQLAVWESFNTQITTIKNNLKDFKEAQKNALLQDADISKMTALINDPTLYTKSLDEIIKAVSQKGIQLEKDLNKINERVNKNNAQIATGENIEKFLQQGFLTKTGTLRKNKGYEQFLEVAPDGLLQIKSRQKSAFVNFLKQQFELTPDQVKEVQKAVKNSAKVVDVANLLADKDFFEPQLKASSKAKSSQTRLLQQQAQAQADADTAKRAAQQIADANAKVAVATAQADQEIRTQQQDQDAYKQSILQSVQASQQFANAQLQSSETLNELRTALDGTNAEYLRMQQRISNLNSIKSMVTNFLGFYQILNLIRTGVRNAINHIKELDSTMNAIAVVSDMTTADLWKQVGAYSEIAQKFGVTIQGAYEVSKIYYQAGYNTNDVLTLTNETLKLSKIASLDYATTTDYMMTAMRGFKLEMEDASHVVDVYSNIASHTAVSQAELAEAMTRTASSMESVGATFEETSAMIATMVAVTRESASNIGSAMKSIASRYGELKKNPLTLIDADGETLDYNKVDTALKSIGISLKDDAGNFRNFTEVILELSESWDQLSSAQQRYIATQFAGNRQQSRFLALVSNADLLKENIENAMNSEGVGDLQAAETLDMITSKINQLQVAYQQFYTTIGLETAWGGFLDMAKNVINTLNGMPKLFGKIPVVAITMITNAISVIKNLLNHGVQALGQAIAAGFKSTETTIQQYVNQQTMNGQQYMQNFIDGVKSKIYSMGSTISTGMQYLLKGKTNGYNNLVGSNTAQISQFYDSQKIDVGAALNAYNNLNQPGNQGSQVFIDQIDAVYQKAKAAGGLVTGLATSYEQQANELRNCAIAAGSYNRELEAIKNGKILEFFESTRQSAVKVSQGFTMIGSAFSMIAMSLSGATEESYNAQTAWLAFASALQVVGAIAAGIANANPIGAIMTALTTGITLINHISKASEEKIKRLQSQTDKLNETAKQLKSNQTTLEKAISNYEELKEKRYESAEAEKEYQDAVQELADKFPELVLGFTETGEAIISVVDMEGALQKAREKSAQATKEAAEEEIKLIREKLKNQPITANSHNAKSNYLFGFDNEYRAPEQRRNDVGVEKLDENNEFLQEYLELVAKFQTFDINTIGSTQEGIASYAAMANFYEQLQTLSFEGNADATALLSNLSYFFEAFKEIGPEMAKNIGLFEQLSSVSRTLVNSEINESFRNNGSKYNFLQDNTDSKMLSAIAKSLISEDFNRGNFTNWADYLSSENQLDEILNTFEDYYNKNTEVDFEELEKMLSSPENFSIQDVLNYLNIKDTTKGFGKLLVEYYNLQFNDINSRIEKKLTTVKDRNIVDAEHQLEDGKIFTSQDEQIVNKTLKIYDNLIKNNRENLAKDYGESLINLLNILAPETRSIILNGDWTSVASIDEIQKQIDDLDIDSEIKETIKSFLNFTKQAIFETLQLSITQASDSITETLEDNKKEYEKLASGMSLKEASDFVQKASKNNYDKISLSSFQEIDGQYFLTEQQINEYWNFVIEKQQAEIQRLNEKIELAKTGLGKNFENIKNDAEFASAIGILPKELAEMDEEQFHAWYEARKAEYEELVLLSDYATKDFETSQKETREKQYAALIEDFLSGMDASKLNVKYATLDFDTSLSAENFVKQYAEQAGLSISEINDLIAQAMEIDSNKAAKDAIKDINFYTKDIAYASLDTVLTLANVFKKDIKDLITGKVDSQGNLELDINALNEIKDWENAINGSITTLYDTIYESINNIVSWAVSGYSSGMSMNDAKLLQEGLGKIGLDNIKLQFVEMSDGLRITKQSLYDIYEGLQQIGTLQSKIMLKDLVAALVPETRSVGDLNREILELQKRQTTAVGEENKALQTQIQILQEAQRERVLNENSTWNFLSNDMLGARMNAINFGDEISKAYGIIDTALKNNYFSVKDYMQLITNFNSVASEAKPIEFFGDVFTGQAEDISNAVARLKEVGALVKEISGKGFVVDLNTLNAGIGASAEGLKSSIDAYSDAMIDSAIKVLQAEIDFVRPFAEMEKLSLQLQDMEAGGIEGFINDQIDGITDSSNELNKVLQTISKATGRNLDNLIKEFTNFAPEEQVKILKAWSELDFDYNNPSANKDIIQQIWDNKGELTTEALEAKLKVEGAVSETTPSPLKEILQGTATEAEINLAIANAADIEELAKLIEAINKSELSNEAKENFTKALEAKKAELESMYSTKESEIQAQLDAAKADADKATSDLNAARSDLVEAQTNLTTANAKITAIEEQLAQKEAELKTLGEEEDARKAELQAIIADLTTQKEDAKKEQAAAQSAYAEAVTNVNLASQILTEKITALNDVKKEAEDTDLLVQTTETSISETLNAAATAAENAQKALTDTGVNSLQVANDTALKTIAILNNLLSQITAINKLQELNTAKEAALAEIEAKRNELKTDDEGYNKALDEKYQASILDIETNYQTGIQAIQNAAAQGSAEVIKASENAQAAFQRIVEAEIAELEKEPEQPNALGVPETPTTPPQEPVDTSAVENEIEEGGEELGEALQGAAENILLIGTTQHQGTDQYGQPPLTPEEFTKRYGNAYGGISGAQLKTLAMPGVNTHNWTDKTVSNAEVVESVPEVEGFKDSVTDTSDSLNTLKDSEEQLGTVVTDNVGLLIQLASSNNTVRSALIATATSTLPMSKNAGLASSSLNDLNTYLQSLGYQVVLTEQQFVEAASAFVNGMSLVKGNAALSKGNVALAKGTQTLMGELGPELYVTGGRYYVAGQNGAEFVNLPNDAIVFNHLQTKRLLENGSAGRGKAINGENKAVALAKGTGPAKASASEVLSYLESYKSLLESMKGASARDLANAGGGGGGGDDDKQLKNVTAEIQRWYNLLRQIDKLEKDISYQEQLRAKIESDRVVNGRAMYSTYKDELNYLDQEIARNKELANLQKSWYDRKREELANSAYGKIFTYDENGLQQYVGDSRPGSGLGLDILENLTKKDVNGEAIGAAKNVKTQLDYLQSVGFDIESLKYNKDGTIIDTKKLKGDKLDEAYVQMMQNFWDSVDGWRDELDSIYDSYHEQLETVLDNEDKRNGLLQEIIDNQLSVEQSVYKAIEEREQAAIDRAQDERDALSDSADKFLDGLSEQLDKERNMYDRNQSSEELNKLRRQLAILQRSGGSASQIRELQNQITSQEQDAYFQAQQDQIDAIKEASDAQLERLDHQIDIMTETLEYQKEHGLLWKEVYDVMAGTPEQIQQFIQENTPDFQSNSALQVMEDLRKLKGEIELWISSRDDSDNPIYTDAGHNWSSYVEASQNRYKDILTDELLAQAKAAFDAEYVRSSDPNAAGAAADAILNKKLEEYNRARGIGTGSSSSGSGTSSSSGSGSGSGKYWNIRYSDGKQAGKRYSTKKEAESALAKLQSTSKSKYYEMVTMDAEGEPVNKDAFEKAYQEYKKYLNATVFSYSHGGLADYTGLAMVHGSKSRPEAFLNAEQTAMWKNDILGKHNSLTSLLLDFTSALGDLADSNTYNTINRGEAINIDKAEVIMNVGSIANDYDARRAGESALEEMLNIARKTGTRGVSRR